MKMWKRAARVRLVALGAVLTVGLAGCGSGSSGGSSEAGSPSDVSAALEEGGTLTVWAWEPTLKDVVPAFEKKYPNVDVELVNAGTGGDQYTALQNAIKAGKGVPDVAQLEYYALPQFVLSDAVTDVSSYGASSLDDTFTTGPWNAVTSGGGVHALPMDSGPEALFYNKAVFDKYGIAVPTTWDEYVEAARALHAADPGVYIANDTGDAGATTSLLWQSGDKPFTVDGDQVSVDLSGPGAQQYAKTWDTLIDEQLLAPIASWSDEWFSGLADGTIASLTTGAWMPANLESGAPGASGQWAVAPMPQWSAGQQASAENGGSSLAIPAASENKALAYGFLNFATVEEGVQVRVDGGAFPATKATLDSPDFLNKSFPYFGGQQVNQVLAESAANVVPGWSYLPYQVYANSIFNDTAGQAYTGSTDVASGLEAWQSAIVDYGKQQGFSVQG